MQIINFNYSKISAEKSKDFSLGQIKTNIQFQDPEKDNIDILKDSEIIKFPFKFEVIYQNKEEKKCGEILFNGEISLSLSKEESKEIWKNWKKKQLPPQLNEFLINLVLRKTSINSLQIEDDLNLPLHLNFPRAVVKQKEEIG